MKPSTVAIIPARGGSKGLPGKNVRPLKGKPLIAWTVEAALASEHIDAVVVSTDSDEIGTVAERFGAEVQQRPESLATDTALVADAIEHVLRTLAAQGREFDMAVLLQATSPSREPGLIDDCLQQLAASDADSIATFSQFDESPMRMWALHDGEAQPFIEGANPWLPRQQLPVAYHLNGQLYAFRTAPFLALKEQRQVFFGKGIARVTANTADIDTLDDFNRAEQEMGSR